MSPDIAVCPGVEGWPGGEGLLGPLPGLPRRTHSLQPQEEVPHELFYSDNQDGLWRGWSSPRGVVTASKLRWSQDRWMFLMWSGWLAGSAVSSLVQEAISGEVMGPHHPHNYL